MRSIGSASYAEMNSIDWVCRIDIMFNYFDVHMMGDNLAAKLKCSDHTRTESERDLQLQKADCIALIMYSWWFRVNEMEHKKEMLNA